MRRSNRGSAARTAVPSDRIMSHSPSKCSHDFVSRLGSGEVIEMFWNDFFPTVTLVTATRSTFRSKAMVKVLFALVSSITAWSLSGWLTTFACTRRLCPCPKPMHRSIGCPGEDNRLRALAIVRHELNGRFNDDGSTSNENVGERRSEFPL